MELKNHKKGMVYSLSKVITIWCCISKSQFNKTQMSKLYDGYRNKEYIDLRNKYEPGYRKRTSL